LTGAQGPCIDTGILIENEGTLTIGLNPLKELCEVAGFSFDAEATKLEQENTWLKQQRDAALTENIELRSQLDAVGLAVAHAAQAGPKTKPPAKR
jgi:hypothetical protein